MYKDVAKVIREHSSIDTISIYHMTQCADLIHKDAPKAYNIELEYSHENSIPLILRPKAVKFLRIRNEESQKFKKNWPPDIWDNLKHLAPGPNDVDYPPKNHQVIQSSLRKYLDQGRRPALKSLGLTGVSPDDLSPWLELNIDALTYDPYRQLDIDVLENILDVLSKISSLHISLPSGEEEDSDDDEEESEFEIDPDVVDILANLPNLERLTLSVQLPYRSAENVEQDEDAAEFGLSAVETLREECRLLKHVQIIFKTEDMECQDNPTIVEYNICRDGGAVNVEIVAPRLLEGTIFDFLQWR
ncbi:hypothetical protein C8R43DRAFT_1023013 [Mycena crocata]|nr:hypothetical protein C8R43DRAFT_1023013 [Mycena crocata]